MSSAGSSPVHGDCEVRPGAGSVKVRVAEPVCLRYRPKRVEEEILLLEWNRGYDFVSKQEARSFLFRNSSAIGLSVRENHVRMIFRSCSPMS